MTNEKYISIGVLTQETGLPKAFLKRCADEGKIPVLKTPKKLLFKLSAVQQALDKIATNGGINEY